MLQSINTYGDESVMNFVGGCISKPALGAALADLLPPAKVLLSQNVDANEKLTLVLYKAHLLLKTIACFVADQEAGGQRTVTVKQSLDSSGELGKPFIDTGTLATGYTAIYLRPLTPP
ncbi:hypothetical protein IQ265_09755 [Nodosilinea sp. LEGE 06152]|uniref:hypothetical protein n=1 Tax=Nodosilinea sp. LEGE 06152 TaxID=2777966 RepID=UPI0018830219|nr:hypothetical protein [Nodosilinea sp. LEGE 06152]MBE9157107.1 hypothetical protein [Nodosilinea sp. LEGE 06152]